jgi:tetratricopeptide (TPR) repeat protein
MNTRSESTSLRGRDGDEDDLTVEALEERLAEDSRNAEVKKDLAYAILDRYLYGTVDKESGDQLDIERVRILIGELPEPLAVFPRAYTTYIDGKYETAADWLAIDLANIAEDVNAQLTCDELMEEYIEPFAEAPTQFWTKLSEAIARSFPKSAAAFTAEGISKGDDVDTASSCFIQALDRDASYWWAAWSLAEIYAGEKNWHSAARFYERALESESAQSFPNLHFDYAWALGKLKRHVEEEEQLRQCIKLDADFEYALNNLGWSLYKQGKFEQALSTFEEAISNDADGKYPLRNRARALTKLKRFAEAIEAWRAVDGGGKPSRYVQAEIERLKELNSRVSQEEQITAEAIEQANEPSGDEESDIANEVDHSVSSGSPPAVLRTAAQHEQLLEETIERLIRQGNEVFGRYFRMYESEGGLYGRQFIVPGLGRIDLLAEEVQSGSLVVIELKRDESHESVVGQISMYMSWVRENIARKNQPVIGIICVFTASPKLALAARNVAGLEVFEYGLSFDKV